MFRSPKALPGRSLAELGSLVPSELPQGSSELRDSPPSERGPPAWTWPGRLRRPLKCPLRQTPRLLPEREQFIMSMYYEQDMNLKEIAAARSSYAGRHSTLQSVLFPMSCRLADNPQALAWA